MYLKLPTSLLILILSSSFTTFPSLVLANDASSGLYPSNLQPLITKANVLLSAGQFGEAAKAYSEVLEQTPTDYLLLYKRATCSFSLSRLPSALEDFQRVLSLTQNTFSQAHLMIARIHLKEGSFALASASLAAFEKEHPTSSEAKEVRGEIEEAQRQAEKSAKERKAQLWTTCVESASAALRYASHSIAIRQTRADCALGSGDFDAATGDLTRLASLLPPSTTALQRIFRLTYFYLPTSPAGLNTIKQCLHFDPDNKPCLKLHRVVKALDKGFTALEEMFGQGDHAGLIKLLTGSGKSNNLLQRFEELIEEEGKPELMFLTTTDKEKVEVDVVLPSVKTHSPRLATLRRALCKAYTHSNLQRKAEVVCEALLGMHDQGEDVDGLVGRGEALLKKEDWEGAVRTFERALKGSGGGDRDIHARLQRAQKLLKQSKQKDYYKVLGVSRDADAKTIKTAFRKAAKTAHPDKGGSEAKMASVNEAYEVLSNPELRARFDAGDDPNDPMGASGGQPFANGQFPFAQFFQQGGGFPGGFPGGGGGSGGFHFEFRGPGSGHGHGRGH